MNAQGLNYILDILRSEDIQKDAGTHDKLALKLHDLSVEVPDWLRGDLVSYFCGNASLTTVAIKVARMFVLAPDHPEEHMKLVSRLYEVKAINLNETLTLLSLDAGHFQKMSAHAVDAALFAATIMEDGAVDESDETVISALKSIIARFSVSNTSRTNSSQTS